MVILANSDSNKNRFSPGVIDILFRIVAQPLDVEYSTNQGQSGLTDTDHALAIQLGLDVAGVKTLAVKRASIDIISSLVFELSNENIIKGNEKYVHILEEAKRKHKEEFGKEIEAILLRVAPEEEEEEDGAGGYANGAGDNGSNSNGKGKGKSKLPLTRKGSVGSGMVTRRRAHSSNLGPPPLILAPD